MAFERGLFLGSDVKNDIITDFEGCFSGYVVSLAINEYRLAMSEYIPRAPDKDRFLFSRMPNSSTNPMFDYLLESSHRDDSNKWSNIGFGEEITQVESIEVNFTNLI